MSKSENLIEKSNILNTLRCTDISLTELRFFCLYLSKLNARNTDVRTVKIPVKVFEDLFETKINVTALRKKTKQMLRRIIEIKTDVDITEITLYSKFKWNYSNGVIDGNYIEVTCNYDIVPYIFELTKSYTSYKLANISKLNSVSKIRLYEIMKQYQSMKTIAIEVEELQKMMCCKCGVSYPFFNRDTLKPAVEAINKYTDIEVTYEKILKCRKVVAIKFYIAKNPTGLPKVKKASAETPVPKPLEVPKPKTRQNKESYGFFSN